MNIYYNLVIFVKLINRLTRSLHLLEIYQVIRIFVVTILSIAIRFPCFDKIYEELHIHEKSFNDEGLGSEILSNHSRLIVGGGLGVDI